MFRFLHTSDWHLGKQADFLPEEARVRYAQERFDTVRRIARLAEGEGCELVVVAGDVFDSNLVERQVIVRALDALETFTVPVFLLPANHDPLDAASIFLGDEWKSRVPSHVTVVEETRAFEIPGIDGLSVVGVPWHVKNPLSDPIASGFGIEPAAGTRILLGHGAVDEFSPDKDDPSLIRAESLASAIRDQGIAYVALGDRHSPTEIPGTAGRAWYSGTPLVTRFDEKDPNNVLVVTLDGEECDVQSHRVGNWNFVTQDFDLAGLEDVNRVADWLAAVEDKQRTAVRLVLRGTLTLAARAQLDEILEREAHAFASLNDWERHTDLVVEPSEDELRGLGESGYVRATVDQLLEEARVENEDGLIAREALNLLYRLSR